VVVRDVRVLAQALAGEFGSPIRAADELRFFLRRADLDPADRAIYLPPAPHVARPGLLLARLVSGWQRERFVTLAVGHHVLRHRDLEHYTYGPDGPLFDSPLEAAEADHFAGVFIQHCRGYNGSRFTRFVDVDSARSARR